MLSNEEMSQVLSYEKCENNLKKDGILEATLGKHTTQFDFKNDPHCLLKKITEVIKMSDQDLIDKFINKETIAKVDLRNRIAIQKTKEFLSKEELEKTLKNLKNFVSDKPEIINFIKQVNNEQSQKTLEMLATDTI